MFDFCSLSSSSECFKLIRICNAARFLRHKSKTVMEIMVALLEECQMLKWKISDPRRGPRKLHETTLRTQLQQIQHHSLLASLKEFLGIQGAPAVKVTQLLAAENYKAARRTLAKAMRKPEWDGIKLGLCRTSSGQQAVALEIEDITRLIDTMKKSHEKIALPKGVKRTRLRIRSWRLKVKRKY